MSAQENKTQNEETMDFTEILGIPPARIKEIDEKVEEALKGLRGRVTVTNSEVLSTVSTIPQTPEEGIYIGYLMGSYFILQALREEASEKGPMHIMVLNQLLTIL